MEVETATAPKLKSGWLIAGDIHYKGCTSYTHDDEDETRNGEESTRTWNGTAFCLSVIEHKQAVATRSKALAMLRRVCTFTRLGYFCLEDDKEKLEAVLAEVEEYLDDYNKDAQFTKVWSDLTPIHVGSSNVAAAKAVWHEVSDVLEELQIAVEQGDVRGIRRQCGRVKQLWDVLPEEEEDDLSRIIKRTRRVARVLVKNAETLEDDAKEELLISAAKPVEMARLRFAEVLESVAGEHSIE